LVLAVLLAGSVQFVVPTAHACPPQNLNTNDCVPDGETGLVDPTVCPILAAVAPGIPGVIGITPEGDTTVGVVGPVWDCPPYGNA
jgi:hypothetical protein